MLRCACVQIIFSMFDFLSYRVLHLGKSQRYWRNAYFYNPPPVLHPLPCFFRIVSCPGSAFARISIRGRKSSARKNFEVIKFFLFLTSHLIFCPLWINALAAHAGNKKLYGSRKGDDKGGGLQKYLHTSTTVSRPTGSSFEVLKKYTE